MMWKKARNKIEIVEFRESEIKHFYDVKNENNDLGFDIIKKTSFHKIYDVIEE